MAGTYKLPLRPADLFTKLGELFSGRQQLTYSLTGRILVCSIVAVKNWERYDPIPEVPYFLEKPLEAAFWGAEIL